MKNIDLTNNKNNEVEYKLGHFPDGEPYFEFVGEFNRKEEYLVTCRITSPEDLFILMEVGDILDRNGVIWNLYIKYLMGMRMDRVMDFNRPFSLHVIGKIISNMHYVKCTILTPHSNRTIYEIRNSIAQDIHPYEFLKNKIGIEPNDTCIVFPDKGSIERYYDTNKEKIYNYVYFDKTRDIKTGNILSFDLHDEMKLSILPKEFMFYDDLCDAGGTFLGELKVLKEKYPNKKYIIRVTHLVNEKGLINLCNNFDTVYVTDSYRDWSKIAKEKGINNLVII